MKIKTLLAILMSISLAAFMVACDDDGGSGNNGNNHANNGSGNNHANNGSGNNNTGECGNNIIDAGEECDGTNIGGATCGVGKSGTVTCTANCKLDMSDCHEPTCGDGIAEGTEECDGNDLGSASSCTDVDSIYKEGTLKCGQDCKYDTSECVADYQHPNPFDDCNVYAKHPEYECAPHNGKPSDCVDGGNNSGTCLQQCDNKAECGMNLDCMPSQFGALGGHCYYQLCGPTASSYGWPAGDTLNATCNFLDGSTEGWCYPIWHAKDGFGLCIENGTAQNGATCDATPHDMEVGVDMSTICDKGACIDVNDDGSGTCISFCDPVAVYNGFVANGTDFSDLSGWNNADTCPTGYACVNYTDIDTDQTDPWGNPNDYILFRTPDYGICLPKDPSTTVDGTSLGEKPIVTCDLITGRQIQTGESCGTGKKCTLMTYASLIGVCSDVDDSTTLAVGDTCEISQDATAMPNCADTSICFYKDPLNTNFYDQNVDPELACVVPCHVDDMNDGIDEEDTACATGLVCASTSLFFTPHHGLPTTTINNQTETETAPSQLGFCVPPISSGN